MPPERIFFVGNVMIDTLLKHRAMAAKLGLLAQYGLQRGGYATLTLHRPSNVDDPAIFAGIMQAITAIAREIPIIFPIHPRTRKTLENSPFTIHDSQLILTEPLGYLEFLHLNMNAKLVLTDSGGLQEETTVLGIPCITMRANTERPITCEVGTNVLVGNDPAAILAAARPILAGETVSGRVPELWDGHAAERIVDILLKSAAESKIDAEAQRR